MGELGYDTEWQLFNTKNFGVPQNRERVYTIGHLRIRGRKQIFPLKGADGEDSIPVKIKGHRDGYRRNTQVFAPSGITEALDTAAGGGRGHHTIVPVQFGIDYCVDSKERKIANCLRRKYDNGVSKRNQEGTAVAIPLGFINSELDGTCRTLKAQMAKNSGANYIRTDSLGATGVSVAFPVLTPDRIEKRQNGRRFKENGEPSFTLTSQDRHGVAIKVKEAVKQGYTEAYEGDSINLTMPNSETRRGRVGKQSAQTLDCACNQGILVKLSDDSTVYAVWYEKYQCYIAIRKLTPRECFRLQGWTDDYFEKAAFVNSDSQLYKQAGNGVTVDVVYEIAKQLSV